MFQWPKLATWCPPKITLLAFTTVSSAEHCIDTETTSTDPTIAASKSKGNLYIKLNHATKLTDKDWFGKSDPFYRDVGSTSPTGNALKTPRAKTRCSTRHFAFMCVRAKITLYIKAVDRDTLKNDMIGDAKISLSNVFQTGREGPGIISCPNGLTFRIMDG
ncbi:hypothetical protein CPC16_000875 [Podila verticillata]|nr:hypothetical protein CPC16_000875 [Podila verticillata]